MKLSNVIYCGDNLEWMRKMPDEFVDLIYADPPFFSNRHYEVIFNDGAEIRSFEDRWKGGIHHYAEWMKDRCFQIHRLLKPAGSLYLHCDWHASHYLKVMLDEVFGYSNFQNEIVWNYGPKATQHGGHFQRKHDIILSYGKTGSRNSTRSLASTEKVLSQNAQQDTNMKTEMVDIGLQQEDVPMEPNTGQRLE